jgi:demethylmenaquinone methyltransferase/2-methoxy-6-polyprenyl-1,4-benzoquinol methylase
MTKEEVETNRREKIRMIFDVLKKVFAVILTIVDAVLNHILPGPKGKECGKKPVFGSGEMFDKFASYYDIGNRFMSLGQDQRWREALLINAEIKPADKLLDLATGSADVAIAAKSKFGCEAVIGLDPSVEMLRVGREKIAKLDLTNISLVEGDAQDMPNFESDRFDKITMSFGIRNVPDRLKALKEMRRVISSNDASRLAIMEFAAPMESSFMGKAAKLFVRYIVPLIGGLITNAKDEYRYLEESIFKFPRPSEFASLIESAGFEMIRISSHACGVVHIYIAKPRI